MENLHHIHCLINSLLNIRLKTLMPEGIPGAFHPSSPDPSEKRCGLALGLSEFVMLIGNNDRVSAVVLAYSRDKILPDLIGASGPDISTIPAFNPLGAIT